MTRQAFEQTSTHEAAVVGGVDATSPEVDSAAASRSRRAQSADFRAAVDTGGGLAIARSGSGPAPSHVPSQVDAALGDSGRPLADGAAWSERVGADVSHAKIVTGERAEHAAASIDAKAFTVGDRVFMGHGQSESSEGGNLLAHELTHVAQQRGAGSPTSAAGLSVVDHGDAREHAARAHDGASAEHASGDAAIARDNLTDVDATQYLTINLANIQLATSTFLGAQQFATQDASATWTDPVALALAVARAVSCCTIEQLRAWCSPKIIEHAIDRGRRRTDELMAPESKPDQIEVWETNKGPMKWYPSVAVEIGNLLVANVTASIKRVMPRYLAARSQAAMKVERERDVCLTVAPEPEATAIIPGHPIDRVVIGGLVDGAVTMDLAGYRTAHPADTVRDTGQLRPIVMQFEAPKGAWFWLRVTQPKDPTAEEVAQELFGTPESAHYLTKAGALFGFGTVAGLREVHKTTLIGLGADPANPESPLYPHAKKDAGTGWQPGTLDPAKEILAGPLAAEAALGQATGQATGKPKAKIVEDARNALLVMDAVSANAAKFGLGGELAGPRAQLDQRGKDLAAGDDAGAATWEVQVTEQKSILGTAALGAAGMVKQLETATKGADPAAAKGGFSLPGYMRQAMRDVVEKYVEAAAVSALVETGRERLAAASQAEQLFPVVLMDGILQGVQKTIDLATNAKRSYLDGKKDHADYDVEGLRKKEEQLRIKVGTLRTKILNDPAGAGELLTQIWAEVAELSTEGDMVGTMDAIDGAFQAIEDADGIFAFIVGDSGELHELRMEAAGYTGTFRAMREAWKKGDKFNRDWAKGRLAELKQDEQFKSFLSRAYAQVKDTRVKTAIAQIVALLAITLLTMGAGAIATGAAAAFELGTTATLLMVSGVEAVTFTTLYTVFFEKDPSVAKFAGELAFNFALFGAMRKFSAMMEAAKLAAPLKAGLEMSGQAVILGASSLAKAEIEKRIHKGESLTEAEVKDICVQGLVMFVAIAIIGRAAAPQLKMLEGLGLEVGTKFRAAAKAGEGVTAMAEALKGGEGANVEGAVELIKAERLWLEKQKAAYDELARVIDAEVKNPPKKGESVLEKTGLTREQVNDLRAALGEHAAQMDVAETMLLLDQIAPGHFTAPKERVPELLGKMGGGKEVSVDEVTGAKTYEIKLPDGTTAKLTESLVPKDAPKSPFAELAVNRAPLIAELVPLPDGTYTSPREDLPRQLAEHQKLGATVESAGMDAAGNRVYEIKYPDGKTLRITESVTSGRPGTETAPTEAQAAEMRAKVIEAQKIQVQRDAQLTALIKGAGEVVCERLILGGGQSAVMDYATLPGGKGAPPGADVVTIPETFAVAPEGSMFAPHGDFTLGQSAPELSTPSLTRQPGEFTADHKGRIAAKDFVSALTMTGYETGMATYKAKVEKVEINPRDGSWPHDTNLRVLADGVWIYSNHVDGAMGLGAPKALGRPGTKLAGGEEAKLLASGKMVHAQESLALPGGGEHVAVIGDGASGAWACEAALKTGAKKVYWFGGGPKAEPAPAEVRVELRKLGLTETQIDTYYRAYNERNAPVFKAIQDGRVELVTGMKDATLVETGPMTGKVEVEYSGGLLHVDGVVSAIGSRPQLPVGMGKGELWFKMTTVVDNGIERVVALEGVDAAGNATGIRLVGSQMTAEGVRDQIVPAEQAKYDTLLAQQANDPSVPKDSRGVPGSIYQAGKNTQLANDPSAAQPARTFIDQVRDGLTPGELDQLDKMVPRGSTDEVIEQRLGADVAEAQARVKTAFAKAEATRTMNEKSTATADDFKTTFSNERLLNVNPKLKALVDAITPANMKATLLQIRDLIAVEIAARNVQETHPDAVLYREVDIWVQQPEASGAEWLAKHPGKKGMKEMEGRPFLKATDFDILAVVYEIPMKGRIVHHEEVKAGGDAPADARAQVDTARDALTKGGDGSAVVKLMQGNTDLTGQIDMSSIGSSTGQTRGVAEKKFEASLELTGKDLEALVKDLVKLEQQARGAP